MRTATARAAGSPASSAAPGLTAPPWMGCRPRSARCTLGMQSALLCRTETFSLHLCMKMGSAAARQSAPRRGVGSCLQGLELLRQVLLAGGAGAPGATAGILLCSTTVCLPHRWAINKPENSRLGRACQDAMPSRRAQRKVNSAMAGTIAWHDIAAQQRGGTLASAVLGRLHLERRQGVCSQRLAAGRVQHPPLQLRHCRHLRLAQMQSYPAALRPAAALLACLHLLASKRWPSNKPDSNCTHACKLGCVWCSDTHNSHSAFRCTQTFEAIALIQSWRGLQPTSRCAGSCCPGRPWSTLGI